MLTADELVTLTGLRRPSAQIRWLRARRIHHYVNAKNRPVVLQTWNSPPPPAPELEPRFIPPPLDRDAVFRQLSEIRAKREVYRIGDGDGSGIYFLFKRWALLYVGQSVDVGARLRAHFIKRLCARQVGYTGTIIWFNKVSVIPVPEYWLDEVESHYITTLQPPCNMKGLPEDVQRQRRIAKAFAWARDNQLPLRFPARDNPVA